MDFIDVVVLLVIIFVAIGLIVWILTKSNLFK